MALAFDALGCCVSDLSVNVATSAFGVCPCMLKGDGPRLDGVPDRNPGDDAPHVVDRGRGRTVRPVPLGLVPSDQDVSFFVVSHAATMTGRPSQRCNKRHTSCSVQCAIRDSQESASKKTLCRRLILTRYPMHILSSLLIAGRS